MQRNLQECKSIITLHLLLLYYIRFDLGDGISVAIGSTDANSGEVSPGTQSYVK